MRGKKSVGKGKWCGGDLIPFLIFYTTLHKDGTPLIESDTLVIALVLHIPSKF